MIKRVRVFILILIFLTSCGEKKVMRDLSDIESYINDRPDSALIAIRQIDTSTVRTKAAQAKYSLLHAMALDKNYIDTSNVSIIMPAVNFYSKHGCPEEKLKAWMYLGTEQYNAGLYNQAIVSFNQAVGHACNIDDQNLLGVLYSKMADTFTMTRDYAQASSIIDLSIDSFRNCGRKDQENKERLRKASNLAQLRKWNEADSLYREVLAESAIDKTLKNSAEIDYSMFLLTAPFEDDERSFELISNVINNGGRFHTQYEYYAYAYLLSAVGRKRESAALWAKLDTLEDNDIDYYYNYWKHREALKDGDYKKAYKHLFSAMQYQDIVIRESYSNSAANSERDYLNLLNVEKELKLKNKGITILLIILLCFSLALLVYILFLHIRKNRRDQEEEHERLNMAIDSLKNQIIEKEKAIKDVARFRGYEKSRAKFIFMADIYEKAYLKSNSDYDSDERLLEALKVYIGNLRSDHQARDNFKKMVDESMDGLMTKFMKDFPDLSEREYDMASYYFAGFDNTTVMIIMNLSSINNTRTMKYRLKQKIDSSSIRNKMVYSNLL